MGASSSRSVGYQDLSYPVAAGLRLPALTRFHPRSLMRWPETVDLVSPQGQTAFQLRSSRRVGSTPVAGQSPGDGLKIGERSRGALGKETTEGVRGSAVPGGVTKSDWRLRSGARWRAWRRLNGSRDVEDGGGAAVDVGVGGGP